MKHTAFVIRRRGYFYALTLGVNRVLELIHGAEGTFRMCRYRIAGLVKLLSVRPFVSLKVSREDPERGHTFYMVCKGEGDPSFEDALWSIHKVEISCDVNLFEPYYGGA